MSPQGVMTHNKASSNPGLNLIKGHKFCPSTQTGSQDKLSSLPLGTTKTSPLDPVLVGQPATEPLKFYDLEQGWPQRRLREVACKTFQLSFHSREADREWCFENILRKKNTQNRS